MTAPRHVFETFIRATPERIWQAITDPDFTRRYFHRTAIESTFTAGAPVRYVLPSGDDAVTGEIEEVEPGRRLVMTWRVLYDADLAAEPPSRVEWVLTPGPDGVTRVTTIHRDLAMSPRTSADVGAGWPWILDSLKSLLETGEPLAGSAPGPGRDAAAGGVDDAEAQLHRRLAIEANQAAWNLLGTGATDATGVSGDELIACAHASAYHWERAAGAEPANAVRAAWLLSRAHVVAGHPELGLHYADRCRSLADGAGLVDFDLAYAHEARARALAAVGRFDEAAVELAAAHAVPIADDEDRDVLAGDLASGPWFGLPAGTPTPVARASN